MSVTFDSPLYRDFPATSKLTREELQELLGSLDEQQQVGASQKQQNDAFFEAFVDSLPQVRQCFDDHRRMLKENESRAERNLGLQPRLEAMRAETQQYYDRAMAAEAHWPAAEAKMREAYRRFAPPSLHAQLVQAASKLHEQSEALASAYVDGLPLDGDAQGTNVAQGSTSASGADADPIFTRRYREMRTEYHRLNLIAERWANGTVQWE